jgi:hypothetical protein
VVTTSQRVHLLGILLLLKLIAPNSLPQNVLPGVEAVVDLTALLSMLLLNLEHLTVVSSMVFKCTSISIQEPGNPMIDLHKPLQPAFLFLLLHLPSLLMLLWMPLMPQL